MGGICDSQAKEAERCLGEDGVADLNAGDNDDGSDYVRQDVPEHYAQGCVADRFGGLDVLEVGDTEHRTSHDAGCCRRDDDADGHAYLEEVLEAVSAVGHENGEQEDGEHQGREPEHHFHAAAYAKVDPSAEVATHEPQGGTDDGAEEDGSEADAQ